MADNGETKGLITPPSSLATCHLPENHQPSTPESNIEAPNTGVTTQTEMSEDEMEPWVSYQQEFSINSQPDQQSVSLESVSEQGSEPQDHHGQENITVQPEATRGGSVWGSRLRKTVRPPDYYQPAVTSASQRRE